MARNKRMLELEARELAAKEKLLLAAKRIELKVSPSEHIYAYALAALAGGFLCGYSPTVRKNLTGVLSTVFESIASQHT